MDSLDIDSWGSIDEKATRILVLLRANRNRSGAWPSGKASGFGPAIRRFESFRPRVFLIFNNKKKDFFCVDKA